MNNLPSKERLKEIANSEQDFAGKPFIYEDARRMACALLAGMGQEHGIARAKITIKDGIIRYEQYFISGMPDGDYKLFTHSVPPAVSEQPAPVAVPECFKRLLAHAQGLAMGVDWNKGTAASHHRYKLCLAVKDCSAMLNGGGGG